MPDSVIKVDNISSLSGGGVGFPDGSVSSPSLNFTNQTNKGFYNVGTDKIGIAIGGSKVGEIGVGYGGFTGNIVQVVSESNNYSNSFTTTYLDINKASGTVWETSITPKLANSKLFIMYKLSVTTNSVYYGARVLQKIANSSYNVIYKPEELNSSSPFGPLDYGSGNAVNKTPHFLPVFVIPTYNLGDTITTKIQCATETGSINGFNNSRTGNNGHSEVFIFEIAG